MLNKILVAVLLFLMLFVGITTVAVKKRPPQKTIVTAQGYSETDNTVYSAYKKIGTEIFKFCPECFKQYLILFQVRELYSSLLHNRKVQE